MENEIQREGEPSAVRRPEYEPPRVESVMSAEDLAREVHYAGVVESKTFG
jgi:hypothetical protein